MTLVFRKCYALLTVILIVAATLFLPASGSAQGRGNGRGLGKKAFKFVNGHDARDGRWDGRGPASGRFRGGRLARWDRGGWVRIKQRRVRYLYFR